MRYYIDTEFIERGHEHPIELISIAMIAEDGAALYCVASDGWDESHASDWVKQNVLPHLGTDPRIPRKQIVENIRNFIGNDPKPEFWAYYADYDWVVFCQLFGAMIDLPKGFPMFCRDIKQLCVDLGNPELPKQPGVEHNALADAYQVKVWHEWLMQLPNYPVIDPDLNDRLLPGLYRKFNVTRTNGSSALGGKHAGCGYIVLDLHHDKFAALALSAYAESAQEEFPELAADMKKIASGLGHG